MNDYRETILAQYANSPTITSLIDCFDQWIDPSAKIDAFFQNIWNIETAVGYGLDVWGKIVGISRILQVSAQQVTFGFNEAYINSASPIRGWNQAVFNNGKLSTQNYSLDDTAYRKLILVKAMSNITNCTAKNVNSMMQFLFADRGSVYVRDDGGMAISYIFSFLLSPVETSIMTTSGAIPRPAGVSVTILQNP